MFFKLRLRKHKSSMLTIKKPSEVAIHYNKISHKLDDFEFFATIEKMNNHTNMHNIDGHLLT